MLDDVIRYLACPHCGAGLGRAGGVLRCPAGHSFDIARQGYVSLLPPGGTAPSGDSPAMVAARAGFLPHYAGPGRRAGRRGPRPGHRDRGARLRVGRRRRSRLLPGGRAGPAAGPGRAGRGRVQGRPAAGRARPSPDRRGRRRRRAPPARRRRRGGGRAQRVRPAQRPGAAARPAPALAGCWLSPRTPATWPSWPGRWACSASTRARTSGWPGRSGPPSSWWSSGATSRACSLITRAVAGRRGHGAERLAHRPGRPGRADRRAPRPGHGDALGDVVGLPPGAGR